ncbi:MAG: hypothetical protein J0H57_19125 [Rhodospirillales bacterium]|nr:hypothetical protein [Rhodospirillales bacterium]
MLPLRYQPSPGRQAGFSTCIGGQAIDPYEQKTQQSPGFGFNDCPQFLQV